MIGPSCSRREELAEGNGSMRRRKAGSAKEARRSDLIGCEGCEKVEKVSGEQSVLMLRGATRRRAKHTADSHAKSSASCCLLLGLTVHMATSAGNIAQAFLSTGRT